MIADLDITATSAALSRWIGRSSTSSRTNSRWNATASQPPTAPSGSGRHADSRCTMTQAPHASSRVKGRVPAGVHETPGSDETRASDRSVSRLLLRAIRGRDLAPQRDASPSSSSSSPRLVLARGAFRPHGRIRVCAVGMPRPRSVSAGGGTRTPDTRIHVGDKGEDLVYPSGSELPPGAPSCARSPEFGARKRRKRKRRRTTARSFGVDSEIASPT
jgi:hypothetical protein